MRDVGEMTEEELRAELMRVRAERAGKGRQKRAVAKEKRVSAAKKVREVKEVEDAEWV